VINHVRTLLLNQSPSRLSPAQFGYEFVPASYGPVPLPGILTSLIRTLFGSAPDAAGMNYRLRQYAGLLHAPEIVSQTLADDSRFTYSLEDTRLFLESHQPLVAQIAGNTPVSFTMLPDALKTESNKLEYRWTVIGSDSGTYGTQDLDQYTVQAPPTWANGLSAPVLLPNSGGISVMLGGGNSMPTSSRLQVSLIKRPKVELAAIPAAVTRVLTEGVAAALFGAGTPGRFKQFADWWYGSDQLHFQLGGVLLALAHRTDLIRQGA
jgi:hypothetical protein